MPVSIIHLSIHPSISLLSIFPSSIYLCMYLSIHLSIHLSMHLSIHLSIYLSIDRSIDRSIQALGEGAPALPSTLIFDHPTARQLAAFFEAQVTLPALEVPTAAAADSYPLVQSPVPQPGGTASAQHISDVLNAANSPLGNCLIRLRLGDPSKPLIFAISSLDGIATTFASLQTEGDLYALQHEHISTGSRAALREASLAGLAAKYAALIIKELVRRDSSSTECIVAPNAPTIRAVPDESVAPFVLIGASFGSYLAHHVAVAAHALGRPAAGLVLIDPFPVPPLLRIRGRYLHRRFFGVPRDGRQVCALAAPSPHPHSTLSTPTPCTCTCTRACTCICLCTCTCTCTCDMHIGMCM